MKKSLCVFNSDRINKYGEVFPVRTLESAIEQKWQTGTPMHLTHDFHRPIGWAYPFSLLFEPSITKLLGMTIFPENEKEIGVINENRFNYFIETNEKDCSPYKNELLSKIKDIVIQKENFIRNGCVSLLDKNIATRVFQRIFDNLDDDGLYSIKNLNHLGSGIFDIDGLALFAHPYFRRSFSRQNNINIAFFDYIDILLQNNIDIKIAFDRDMVGLSSTYLKPMELEYWWGPKFDQDLLKIQPGVTRHTANELDKEFYRISETDFFWYSRKETKTLEIEEILDIPSFIDNEKYICRYIHSMVNEHNSEIFHLDGAVRIYSEDKMIERISQDLSKSSKNTEYIKLFRIDENLDICEWKRIISDYFKDNHLIGEYFGAKDTSREQDIRLKYTTSEPIQKNQYTCHPFSLNNNEGFLFNYSYQPSKDNKEYDLDLISFDSLLVGEERIHYFEAPIWELIKIFKAHGLEFNIPSDYQTIAFEDLYYNFPLIILNNSSKILNNVFCSYLELLNYYSENEKEERQVSFSVEYPLDEHNIRLSFLGSAVQLVNFFDKIGFPPPSKISLKSYINKVSLYLKDYREIMDKDTLAIVKNSAMLVYARKFFDDEVNIEFNSSEDGDIKYEISNIKDEPLYRALSSGDLAISTANIIQEEECKKCGNNYFICDCNIVNKDTYKIVKKIKPIGLFYTDKKA